MSDRSDELPDAYRSALRTLVKYGVGAAIFALLSGVLFQESSKKVDFSEMPPGPHLEATIHLALVHGHAIVIGFLVPAACAGLLLVARRVGGATLTPRPLRWLTRGYLPCASATIALMLYKGYHVLLMVRGGETDFDAIDDAYFGGLAPLRHGVYAVAHVGMAISLGVYLVALWRSLGRR